MLPVQCALHWNRVCHAANVCLRDNQLQLALKSAKRIPFGSTAALTNPKDESSSHPTTSRAQRCLTFVIIRDTSISKLISRCANSASMPLFFCLDLFWGLLTLHFISGLSVKKEGSFIKKGRKKGCLAWPFHWKQSTTTKTRELLSEISGFCKRKMPPESTTITMSNCLCKKINSFRHGMKFSKLVSLSTSCSHWSGEDEEMNKKTTFFGKFAKQNGNRDWSAPPCPCLSCKFKALFCKFPPPPPTTFITLLHFYKCIFPPFFPFLFACYIQMQISCFCKQPTTNSLSKVSKSKQHSACSEPGNWVCSSLSWGALFLNQILQNFVD